MKARVPPECADPPKSAPVPVSVQARLKTGCRPSVVVVVVGGGPLARRRSSIPTSHTYFHHSLPTTRQALTTSEFIGKVKIRESCVNAKLKIVSRFELDFQDSSEFWPFSIGYRPS